MQDVLECLEWPQLLKHLCESCATPYGVTLWQTQPFLPDAKSAREQLEHVEHFRTLLVQQGASSFAWEPQDCHPLLGRLQKGGMLSLTELSGLTRTLSLLNNWVSGWQACDTANSPFIQDILLPTALLDRLLPLFSEQGDLLDTATPALYTLRQKLRTQKSQLDRLMHSLIQAPEVSRVLQTPQFTERDGRWVLPVRNDWKAELPGIVHSTSGSGATVFIEPQQCIPLNNKIQSLYAEIEVEVQKLLQVLSAVIAEQVEEITTFLTEIASLDRIYSSARLALALDAYVPEILPESVPTALHLVQARHPLLVLRKKAVIANDILLTAPNRTLVITGPNTGGKTVLLKTVGLLACMIKAGLPIPAKSGSEIAWFEPICVDIGDGQSLVQDLSTFSAHLRLLKDYLSAEQTLSNALILIDELGAGTDPAEGAALAKAVLAEFYTRGALTLITTHLGELKLEAHQQSGYLNASVLFDIHTLQPTYQLLLGSPGTSHALTIAEKLGLPPQVIADARSRMQGDERDVAALIESLEIKHRDLDEKLKRAEAFQIATTESYEKQELTRQQQLDEGKKTLHNFRNSLKSRMHQLEDALRILKKELQKAEAERESEQALERTYQLLDRFKELQHQSDSTFHRSEAVLGKFQAPQLLAIEQFIEQLQVGMTVKSRSLNLEGSIRSINLEAGQVELQAGTLRTHCPFSDLQLLPTPSHRRKKKPPGQISHTPKRRVSSVAEESSSNESTPLETVVVSECDVRGQRVDEALTQVRQFLDAAILEGHSAVAIIHGQGTGALKQAIRQNLKQEAQVKRFYPSEARYGGDGRTIIEFW